MAESSCDRQSHVILRRCATVFVLPVLWLAQVARGQDDDEKGAVVVRRSQITINEQDFNRLVFGSQSTADTVRREFETALVEEIQAMDRVCMLTESQQKKLKLAAQGDWSRFLRRVEDLRGKYQQSQLDQQGYSQMVNEMASLRVTRNSGFFVDESLFYKTLRGILTKGQLPRYRDIERKRQVAVVERAFAPTLRDTNAFRLTDEQRQQVITLLVNESDPPTTVTPFSHYVVFLHAAKLEAPLRRLLDDQQWQLFQYWISRAREMEPTLRSAHLLPESKSRNEELSPDSTNKEHRDVP